MRLEDLKKSLLDMTEDEVRNKIREIRADRVIRKESKKQKVAKVKTKATAVAKAAGAASGMTPAELQKLLEEFE